MIYVTQLVYVREGEEAAFEQFEDAVLPLLGRYQAELVLRLRPDAESKVSGSADAPYELHVLRFDSEADLEAYSNDHERRRWLHLREQSVHASLTVKGMAL